MKKSLFFIVLFSSFGIFSFAEDVIINQETYASYYGESFNGRPTASGEIFDMNAFTAAHKVLPFGTWVEVTNLENGKKVVVRINDRGPFVGGREIDLSKAAAQVLGMLLNGITRVSIKKIDVNNNQVLMNAAASSESTNATPSNNEAMPYNHAAPAATQNYEPQSNSMSPAAAPAKNLVYYPTTPEETSGPLWRIQLGSFSREENALRLVVQLRKIGFEPAYERTETNIRVVLHGITPNDLEKVKLVLDENKLRDYVLKQESW